MNSAKEIIAGVLCTVLILATVIGQILRMRAKSEKSRATVDNLNARVYAWWVMIGVLGVAVWLGLKAVIILFAIISFFALREFLTLTPTRRGDHRAIIASFFLALPGQYALIWWD